MMRERRGSSILSHRVPLELKTGKMQRKQGTIEHRAQLTLYSMMVGDRYETPPPGGLLYYLKSGHMQGLPTLPHEKRGMALFNSLLKLNTFLDGFFTCRSADCKESPGSLP